MFNNEFLGYLLPTTIISLLLFLVAYVLQGRALQKRHSLFLEAMAMLIPNSGDFQTLINKAEILLKEEVPEQISRVQIGGKASAHHFLEGLRTHFPLELVKSYGHGSRGNVVSIFRVVMDKVPIYLVAAMGNSRFDGDFKWANPNTLLDLNDTINEEGHKIYVNSLTVLHPTGKGLLKKELIERAFKTYKVVYVEDTFDEEIEYIVPLYSVNSGAYERTIGVRNNKGMDFSPTTLDLNYPKTEITYNETEYSLSGTQLVKTIAKFLENGKVVLATGEPGLGKTALIQAVSSTLKDLPERIGLVVVTPDFSKIDLLQAFLLRLKEDYDQVVVFLDDMASSMDNKGANHEALKRLLDGVLSSGEISYFITRNNTEDISDAMKRRISLVVEGRELTKAQAESLGKAIQLNTNSGKYGDKKFDHEAFFKFVDKNKSMPLAKVWSFVQEQDVLQVFLDDTAAETDISDSWEDVEEEKVTFPKTTKNKRRRRVNL